MNIGLEVWLQWYSTCLAIARLQVQTTVPQRKTAKKLVFALGGREKDGST
jgi:hypothetical protein